MSSSPNGGAAFKRLKPITTRVVDFGAKEEKAAEIKALIALVRELRVSDRDGLCQCMDYALFPVMQLAELPSMNILHRELALECVGEVVAACPVQGALQFADLFVRLTLLISTKPGASSSQVVSTTATEEMKLAVVKALNALLSTVFDPSFSGPDIEIVRVQVSNFIQDSKFRPAMGHTVSLALECALEERSRALRLAALTLVLTAVGLLDAGPLAFFLPGIASACSKIAVGDFKQGTSITTLSVRVWRTAVVKAMKDAQHPAHIASLESKHSLEALRALAAGPSPGSLLGGVDHQTAAPVGSSTDNMSVTRDSSWIESTSARLRTLLTRLLTLVTHPRAAVRVELCHLSKALLVQCPRTMPSSIAACVEAVVSWVHDDDEEVRSLARVTIEELRMHGHKERAMQDTLQECFSSLLTVLPRVMHGTDETLKLHKLRTAAGFLALLGNGASSLLSSSLRRLSLALCQLLEFDVSDVKVVEGNMAGDEESVLARADGTVVSRLQQHRRSFAQFRDVKVYHAAAQVCRLVGAFGDTYSIVDHFLSLGKNPGHIYSKQAILIVQELVLGCAAFEITGLESATPKPELEAIVHYVVDTLLWLLNSRRGQGPHEGSVPAGVLIEKPSVIEHISEAALWKCLLLESLGCCAKALGPPFASLLIKVLYPLLEHQGDLSASVADSASISLSLVARACGYDSVRELVLSNSDYVVDAMQANLRHLDVSSAALQVLPGTLLHTGAAVLPLLHDTMKTLLAAIDQRDNRHARAVARSLHDVIRTIHSEVSSKATLPTSALDPEAQGKAVRQPDMIYGSARAWYAAFSAVPTEEWVNDTRRLYRPEEEEEETSVASLEKIRDYFNEHHKHKEQSGVRLVGEKSYSSDDEEEQEGEKIVPLEVSTARALLEKCIHLVASDDRSVQRSVLNIVRLSIEVLAAFEAPPSERRGESTLLPSIHDSWPSLVCRINSDDPNVTLAALEVVDVMSEAGGNFIAKRFAKDIWPVLAAVLKCPLSTNSHSQATRKHMAGLFTLRVAWERSVFGRLPTRLLEDMVDVVTPFLSSQACHGTQEHAVAIFRLMLASDEDLLWPHLACLSAFEAPPSPGPAFVPVQLLPLMVGGHDKWVKDVSAGRYVKNARAILRDGVS